MVAADNLTFEHFREIDSLCKTVIESDIELVRSDNRKRGDPKKRAVAHDSESAASSAHLGLHVVDSTCVLLQRDD